MLTPPPRLRARLSLASWTVVAGMAGLLAGGILAALPARLGTAWVLAGLRELAGLMFAGGVLIAGPLMLASIVRGANGLEAMRGVGRLAWKTGGWIAGSTAVAVLIGLGVGLLSRPSGFPPAGIGTGFEPAGGVGMTDGGLWIALVGVALAFGVYRNQIEESRARQLVRLAMAVDETVTLLLEWSLRLVPVAFFFSATQLPTAAVAPAYFREVTGLWSAVALGWTIYGLGWLPFCLLVFARVNPWRYARAVLPAVLAALAGGPSVAVFPLALHVLRTRGGVSNRVASVTLAGSAVLLRDTQALGWTVVVVWMGSGVAIPMMTILSTSLALSWLGSAVNVFSQTCAVAVLARFEGEPVDLSAWEASGGRLNQESFI